MASIPEALSIALQHQQAGRLAEAEGIYRQVLNADPKHADAWHLFGVLAHWTGRKDVAASSIARAISFNQTKAVYFTHLAVALRDLGRAPEAWSCYRRALALDPASADTLYNMGNLLNAAALRGEAQLSFARSVAVNPDFPEAYTSLALTLETLGRRQEAYDVCRRAVARMPQSADLHFRLGDTLRRLERWKDAVPAYDAGLSLCPDRVDAQLNRGLCFYYTGRFAAAATAFRRVAALRPDVVETYNNLGSVLQFLGRSAEAESAHRLALRADPLHADSYSNMGVVLANQGRVEQGLAYHHCALALRPESPNGLLNMASALASLGRHAEAVTVYRRALRLTPGNSDLWVYLGTNLQNQGIAGEAMDSFAQAARINPGNVRAHNGFGNLFLALGRLDEAASSFRHALTLDPAYPEAWNNLGAAHRNQGRQDIAAACFRRAIAGTPDDTRLYSNMLLTLCYQAGVSDQDLFAEHRAWAARHADPLMPAKPAWANPRDPERRLRIGYMSPDLRTHAAAYFLEPMFEQHDHDRFEIICYAEVARPDSMTERLRSLVDGWMFTVGVGDEDLARRIRADGIDILVDLAGHTGNNRLLTFARKPAPVQATYLGYATTTGMKAMDYLITDPWSIAPNADLSLYTETIWRLPEVLRCYQPPKESPAVGPLPAGGNGHITFGSFNAYVKVTPPVIALWSRVLLAVPNSVMLIITDAPPAAVHARFAPYGIGPDRLRIIGRRKLPEFLALHNEIDIALDTFPHTGGTTSLHSLWMGVPVVSLVGRRIAERGGIGVLGPAGLSELAVDTPDDYVTAAVRLAGDRDRLSDLRAALRGRMERSAFVDSVRFTRQMEDAYRRMWQLWCTGEQG